VLGRFICAALRSAILAFGEEADEDTEVGRRITNDPDRLHPTPMSRRRKMSGTPCQDQIQITNRKKIIMDQDVMNG
jgi:hypothetical protein